MSLSGRRAAIEAGLLVLQEYWRNQPFIEPRPAWCDASPALEAAALALSDAEVDALTGDADAALGWLQAWLPEAAELRNRLALPALPVGPVPGMTPHFDWAIPGRKRAQIEAFARVAAADSRGDLLDWCGGKGHLGRLLAVDGKRHVSTVELDPALCAAGRQLAARAGAAQDFVVADALRYCPDRGRHALALHACGELHRQLIRQADGCALPALDIAPCCYHKGLAADYTALSGASALHLRAADVRLAVTESATAKSRELRRHDRAQAWKLGVDAWRREIFDGTYRPFQPTPLAWLDGDFSDFAAQFCAREGLPAMRDPAAFEARGRARWQQVRRYSVVRQAFRRAIELWLLLDLAVYLENQGYSVRCGSFCPPQLTPRNLLLSARR